MYQHPQALSMNASYQQQEALRDADHRRLVEQAHEAEAAHHTSNPSSLQRRMVAMAVALVTVLGLVVLAI